MKTMAGDADFKLINEIKGEWGCSASTIREYCRSGIIPPAEKVGRPMRWAIPNGWPKPPMTRHGLCFLMERIELLKEGVSFDAIRWGYSYEKVVAGFDYLVQAGFISTVDTSELATSLLKAKITTMGNELLKREKNENGVTTKTTVSAGVKVNLGVVSTEIKKERSYER